MADKIGTKRLRIGYGLPLNVAKPQCLFISRSHGSTLIKRVCSTLTQWFNSI